MASSPASFASRSRSTTIDTQYSLDRNSPVRIHSYTANAEEELLTQPPPASCLEEKVQQQLPLDEAKSSKRMKMVGGNLFSRFLARPVSVTAL
jgi:hypothetical protein